MKTANTTTRFFHPIDLLLKGPEVALPGGRSFLDTDGKTRYNTRLRWWVNPARSRFAALSFQEKELGDAFGDCPVPEELKARAYYREDDRPVFFGHYWLKGEPHLQRDNVCCLDFSVAQGGRLACYRFDGEQRLSAEKFVWVGGDQ